MKIAIIPRVRIFRKKQIEYCVERKLIIFLNKIYKNSSIVFLNEIKKNNDFDVLIISGGNDLTKFSNLKEDIIKHSETGNLYEPKSTKHLIFCNESKKWHPITLVSSLYNLSLK